MFDLTAKTAVVTGGSSGIGLAVARRLRDAGARVLICSRSERDESKRAGLDFQSVDMRQESSVQALFEAAGQKLGQLDILVLNAGISVADAGELASEDAQAFRDVLEANTAGVLLGLKHGARFMRDAGSIIVTSSIAADTPFPGYMLYSSSKAALLPLVRHAAMKLGGRGIRVNMISPGTILTPMQSADDPEARLSRIATCLRRAGTPADVVGAAHFLAAAESSYISAAELRIDGGWLGGLTNELLERLSSGAQGD